MTIALCKGCSEPCCATHMQKYNGYCFECWNRGAPERDELREKLARLTKAAQEAVDEYRDSACIIPACECTACRLGAIITETNHAD